MDPEPKKLYVMVLKHGWTIVGQYKWVFAEGCYSLYLKHSTSGRIKRVLLSPRK